MSTSPFRINHQIQAKEVRLLRDDGTQIGVMPLSEALSQAKSQNLDVVEIAASANPPVAKLIDYKKFLYQLAKKERTAKAAAKKVELKEIRLTPFMAENDFTTRLNRMREFLSEGHKVRVTVKFVGRQLSHKEFADQIFTKTLVALESLAVVDQEPKWLGKQFSGTLSPVKTTKKN